MSTLRMKTLWVLHTVVHMCLTMKTFYVIIPVSLCAHTQITCEHHACRHGDNLTVACSNLGYLIKGCPLAHLCSLADWLQDVKPLLVFAGASVLLDALLCAHAFPDLWASALRHRHLDHQHSWLCTCQVGSVSSTYLRNLLSAKIPCSTVLLCSSVAFTHPRHFWQQCKGLIFTSFILSLCLLCPRSSALLLTLTYPNEAFTWVQSHLHVAELIHCQHCSSGLVLLKTSMPCLVTAHSPDFVPKAQHESAAAAAMSYSNKIHVVSWG